MRRWIPALRSQRRHRRWCSNNVGPIAPTSSVMYVTPIPEAGGLSWLQMLHREQQVESLLGVGQPLPMGDVGSAGTHRVMHNLRKHRHPGEPSCVEVRQTRKWDEDHHDASSSPRDTDSTEVGTGERRRVINFGALRKPKPLGDSDKDQDDGVEIVFYFETSTDGGLAGFRSVADRVLEGSLPGSCRNFTGQGGFATWTVPRRVFAELVRVHPSIAPPNKSE